MKEDVMNLAVCLDDFAQDILDMSYLLNDHTHCDGPVYEMLTDIVTCLTINFLKDDYYKQVIANNRKMLEGEPSFLPKTSIGKVIYYDFKKKHSSNN